MTPNRPALMLLPAAMLVLPLLAGCNRASQPPPATAPIAQPAASTAPPQTALGRIIDRVIRRARVELKNGNLDLSNGAVIRIGRDRLAVNPALALPAAQITPQGDLLIQGQAVAVSAEQRALLLAYRKQALGIAETGMAMGAQGAELAGKAVTQVLGSVFSGKGDEFGQRMNAEGGKLAVQARQLCTQLGPMRATQQRLAAALPAFKPYARMTQADIVDCRQEGAAVSGQ